MKFISGILLFIFLLSCNSGSRISKEDYDDLKQQIVVLNKQIDSLENELKVKYDIRDLLQHDSLLFSYRRTACLGNCPIFDFKVYQDGWASYEGKSYVDMLGIYTANLTQEQMRKIESIFRDAHFYAFRNEYNDNRLDIPSMIVEYHGPQGIKKVNARTEIPHSFRTMAVALEELADEIKWYPVQ